MNKIPRSKTITSGTIGSFPQDKTFSSNPTYTTNAVDPTRVDISNLQLPGFTDPQLNADKVMFTFGKGAYFIDKSEGFIARITGISWKGGYDFMFSLNKPANAVINNLFTYIPFEDAMHVMCIRIEPKTGATGRVFTVPKVEPGYDSVITVLEGFPQMLRSLQGQPKNGFVEPILVGADLGDVYVTETES